jgi:mRNA interferase MazF
MKSVKRGMVIDINLNPVKGSETGKTRPCIVVTNDIYNKIVPVIQVVSITSWSEKKSMISTNIVLEPTKENGLTKKSIADCLQTRPIDWKLRLTIIRGQLSEDKVYKLDKALGLVFDLM